MEKNRRRGTLASIAADVGVSRTTVSNAYNRPDQLSTEMRERILSTAVKLGYPGPDPMARGLRMRRVGAVGVVLTEDLSFAFDDPASVDFLAGLSEQLGRRGDSLLVIPASACENAEGSVGEGDDAAAHPAPAHPALCDGDLIRQAVVDGFVVYSVADNDPFLGAVRDRNLPMVICDQPADAHNVPFVGIDDRQAIKPAVEHLLELGHTNFGIITARLSRTPNNGLVSAQRLEGAHHQLQKARVEGALEVLEANGVDRACVPVIERHYNNREMNLDAAREMLEEHPEVTAVICTTDTMALGVLAYAREHGIRVPEDVSVTGFDGIETARLVGLTTILQPNRDKGRAVGTMLAELLDASTAADASTDPSAAPQQKRTLLETSFLTGRTTAAPRT